MVNVWLKYGYTNRTSHVLGPTKDEKHPWDVDIHRGPDIFQGYAHFAKEKKRKNPSTNPIMQSKCHRNPKCHRKSLISPNFIEIPILNPSYHHIFAAQNPMIPCSKRRLCRRDFRPPNSAFAPCARHINVTKKSICYKLERI